MRVGIFSTKKFEIAYFNRLNIPQHELLFIEQALNKNSYLKAKDCEAIAIFSNDDCSEAVLNLLKSQTKVKFIATRSAGTDHINLKVAKTLEFKVAYVPQYSPYAIAELVITLILALNRKIVQADKKVKQNNFLLDDLIGFDLHGKTVGIIGLGRIGAIVAKILNGFGCKLLGFDPNPNQEFTAEELITKRESVKQIALKEVKHRLEKYNIIVDEDFPEKELMKGKLLKSKYYSPSDLEFVLEYVV
ncbi:MAG: hypothetical protein RL711_311 [Bacteroidota bacterium]